MSALEAMTSLEMISEIESAHQPALYAKRDIAIVRGEGAYLFDSEGRRYLDAMSNYGVASLGHADPVFTAAMTDQLQRLTSCHQSFYNDARAAALAAIARVSPDGLTRSFLSNSGAEAIETAVKFARVATGRHQFVAIKRGYHGRTIGALGLTADPKYRGPFEPLPGATTHVGLGDVDALASAITTDTAAVVVEPIQGEAGIYPAPEEFLRAARELTRERGALLIADEIQTGFRTGAPYAITASGVVPDIVCAAKAIGNGFPVGVTSMSEAVAEALPAGIHGTTFGANPMACRAIVTTLSAFEERGLYEQSARVGSYLLARLEAMESPRIRAVRGRGLMIGVELKERVTPVLRGLQQRGVLALPASPVVFRLLPPLIWTEREADVFLEALSETLG